MSPRLLPLLLVVLCACASSRGVRNEPGLEDDRSYLLLVPDQAGAPEGGSEPWAAWPGLGNRLVDHASAWVGLSSLRRVSRSVPDDCSGLIRLALSKEGIELANVTPRRGESLTRAIHRRAEQVGGLRQGPPRPGDLVFFRDTYDRNRDGRQNDGLTHVGFVEGVDAEGTVTFIHRGQQGVRRSRMNPLRPRVHRDARGQVLNDYLRRAGRKRLQVLSGELFEGYAEPEVEW